MMAPLEGAVFVVGDNVNLAANASDPDGQVMRVEFLANGSLVGSASSAPYSFTWVDVPFGVFNVAARAIDNSGASTTSSNVYFNVKKSPGSVNHAIDLANSIVSGYEWTGTYPGATGESANSAAVVANLEALAIDIQNAYLDFTLERNLYGSSSDQIATQLMASYYFARGDAALAGQSGPSASMKAHLQRVIGHLSITEDLMRYGSITPQTIQLAILVNARMDLVIGNVRSGLSPAADGFVSSGSLGSVFGDAVNTPLSPKTEFAEISEGALPNELSGVSVSINGQSTSLFYTSAGRVVFYVPKNLPAGEAEVIVISQSGYVSKGLINVQPNVTRIMTAADDETGPVLAVNDAKQMMEGLPVTTQLNLSTDKRTRVTFFATGVSGSASNTDTSNDVSFDGKVFQNLAENVVVEARTQDNRVYRLPVEFAGARGVVPGLDQLNVVLVPELQGAGTVELTLIVNGRRSNAPTIVVQ
jgi:uncharacterized protein (TIGR03437 family)